MKDFVRFTKEFGAFSLDNIWFPVLIWTVCCMAAFLFLRARKQLNPLYQYHLRTAALLSLPLGIIASTILKLLPAWFSNADLETAFFIVQSPIEIVPITPSMAQKSLEWQEPSFFIGVITLLLLLGSAYMFVRFIRSYIELKKLYKNLEWTTLDEMGDFKQHIPTNKKIRVAFNDHHLVPFTFGWKNPIVVLPDLIKNDSEKLGMALQHELVHITRKDYLLQLALAMIESMFWFHPLIRFGNQEIDTYREISCDQEVLSKNEYSPKSYASLLYELVPLNSGPGRLSVSMAVKNSTLKQRIKTMKYHKLYRTSFKQSIFFLFLMIAGITLPIACSDLRGPDTPSFEELEATKFQLMNPSIEINGKEISTNGRGGVATSGMGAIFINTGEYGVFKIALQNFEGGTLAGNVEENQIRFKINQLEVRINSSNNILSEIDKTGLWVQHSSVNLSGFSTVATVAQLSMEKFLSDYAIINSRDEEDDFFVVVEQMPQPIGGIKAIQSKVQYPTMARRAGIEGRVTVQFIVDENGDVVQPKVVRGIGGGCDEEALRVIKEAKFEPGIQRGRPVRVQFALSINFRLADSDISTDNIKSSDKESSNSE